MFRILVPVDADEARARRAAETVAALPGDPEELAVLILNVYQDAVVRDEGGDFDTTEVYDPTDFPDSVAGAERTLAAAGIESTRRRETGDPAECIVDVAEEIDADGIVISGRRMGTFGRVFFGSVTQSVLLETDRTVIVAGGSDDPMDEEAAAGADDRLDESDDAGGAVGRLRGRTITRWR